MSKAGQVLVAGRTPLIILRVVSQGPTSEPPKCKIVARHAAYYNPGLDPYVSERDEGKAYLERIKAHQMRIDTVLGKVVLSCQPEDQETCDLVPLVISDGPGEPVPLSWTRFILRAYRLPHDPTSTFKWGSTPYSLMPLTGGQEVLVSFQERNHERSLWDLADHTHEQYRDMMSALAFALQ